ncbi:hypothetical protein ONE63_003859 [Megalurothrips usitatus]|uniref:E3 ubiquitin-protein ligase FANCL n=1 Tax=Megalurothrips usitatus TaxID=439358 RepID=A0AAV7X4B7_9NEOP|nr:hypothetical protein ONE63_003859 [Megalurothrips usitatus]
MRLAKMTSSHADMQCDILKKFPLLVPTSSDFRQYEGFLEAKNILFRVSFVVPNYPSCENVALDCEWKLSELLNYHRATVSAWTTSEKPFNIFLDELLALIIRSLEDGGMSRLSLEDDSIVFEEQLDNLQSYSIILSELKELGTENLVSINNDFTSISLSFHDSNDHSHLLNLKLFNERGNNRKHFGVVDTDLPEAVVKIIQKDGKITKAFRTFCEQIEVLQNIWTSLFTIDQQCWVIDPVHPRKADMYRRIYISPPSVMAQISWNPLKPNQPPEIKFQGADAEIDVLRCTYEEHLEDWGPECSIIENLCSVLQLSSLPQPPPPTTSVVSQTVETGECIICYQIQLEGKLPEESCGKCLSSFHTACLYEWLGMMPGSRQVHGHISGPCPNCETVMKCPCPHNVA